MPREKGERMIARNRRATHDYSIGERLEAGIVLTGTEVKSLRDGRASLADAFATIDDGEVWLHQANIPEYSMGSWRRSHTALRKRKLLLHRQEIARLERQLASSGRTLVPCTSRTAAPRSSSPSARADASGTSARRSASAT